MMQRTLAFFILSMEDHGGGVAERLECWTCNTEDPSSSPTLTASWICFTENLCFKSSTTLVNNQLVCLLPVGIYNPVLFNLYVDLIISWKPVSSFSS